MSLAGDVVRRYWALMQSNDWVAVGEVLADDFVLDWPQSRERIRGRDAYARMNAQFPAAGTWRFDVRHVFGDGDQVVSEVAVSDGERHDLAITMFELRDGRIRRIVEFWPEPYAPAADRAGLVERMPDDEPSPWRHPDAAA